MFPKVEMLEETKGGGKDERNDKKKKTHIMKYISSVQKQDTKKHTENPNRRKCKLFPHSYGGRNTRKKYMSPTSTLLTMFRHSVCAGPRVCDRRIEFLYSVICYHSGLYKGQTYS
jgi:hypothetical protein